MVDALKKTQNILLVDKESFWKNFVIAIYLSCNQYLDLSKFVGDFCVWKTSKGARKGYRIITKETLMYSYDVTVK